MKEYKTKNLKKFKKLQDLIEYIMTKFKNKGEITKSKYAENGRGEDYGKIENLILFYCDDIHIATWTSTKQNGWVFDNIDINKRKSEMEKIRKELEA